MRLRPSVSLLALSALCACGSTGPATMSFVSINPAQPRIGDVVTVTFALLDDRGLPLAGQDVNFKLQSDNPGVDLSPKVFTSLKGSGIATTQLQVKSRVTSVIVVASAGSKTVYSTPISVAGSVPNGKQFTFQCGAIAGDASGGRHALGAFDPSRNLIAGEKIECTAHTGDRNGDGVPGALVSFLTEAGTIGPTEVSLTNIVGNATILYKTSYPLPLNVDPGTFSWSPGTDNQTGELLAPTWMEPYMWIANPLQYPRPPSASGKEPSRLDPLRKMPDGTQYRNNPRDNLVTMIAVTSGEEGFVDLNNNGQWDTNEPFDDLPEPFVDSNDNGKWDAEAGERFIDINGNKTWDGKNNQWDSNTLIWTQERILWTGIPHELDGQGAGATVKVVSPTSTVHFCCPTGNTIQCGGTPGTVCNQARDQASDSAVVDFIVYIADPWFNSIASNANGEGCTMGQAQNSPVITFDKTSNPDGIPLLYPAGRFAVVSVQDKRDPNISQAGGTSTNPGRRVPAVSFTQPIQCKFTSSPIGGNVVRFEVGAVSGDIE